MQKITIATRKSPLAMWQAEFIKSELERHHKGIQVGILSMTTKGDVILDSPLSKVGGKGLFVKELELALLKGHADIAVHSMKDLPMNFPKGLRLGPICEREDPRDAFISNIYPTLDSLPLNAVVGTSSLRRQCQLQRYRPDLTIKNLRGNVNTRLAKLDAGEYDAIILAAAGMIRLQMESRIREWISTSICLPACGQGALGIELRTNDKPILDIVSVLHHEDSALCVWAERAMNKRLNGGCQVPIGGFAELTENVMHLRGLVGSVDGTQMLYAESKQAKNMGERLGVHIAKELLAQGADKILASVSLG